MSGKANSIGSKSGVTRGREESDSWRLTTDLSGSASPLSANLERSDANGQGNMGTGMKVASGIWTFPSNGWWMVWFKQDCFFSGSKSYLSTTWHYYDGSSWINHGDSHQGQGAAVDYSTVNHMQIFAIEDCNNRHVKIVLDTNGSLTTRGSSVIDKTWFRFVRLGDI